jgi:hypothetical protein
LDIAGEQRTYAECMRFFGRRRRAEHINDPRSAFRSKTFEKVVMRMRKERGGEVYRCAEGGAQVDLTG